MRRVGVRDFRNITGSHAGAWEPDCRTWVKCITAYGSSRVLQDISLHIGYYGTVADLAANPAARSKYLAV